MKKVLIFLMLITAFTVATPLNADCYSDCDYGCSDYQEDPTMQYYYLRCLSECYQYCVSIGSGGGSGGCSWPCSY